MRLRAPALLVASAMIAPAAAAAEEVGCDVEMVLTASCCCDGEVGGDELPTTATIDGVCCCDLERAPAGVFAMDTHTLATTSRPEPLAPPAGVIADWRVDLPRTTVVVPPPRARGPPPARTLLAQHTSLVC